jgi:L-2-hydroxyglutarate oxidase LhgO
MDDSLSAAHRRQDVLVIGGGLIGLSTAMHLAQLRPDLAIALIEKDASLTSQQSGHNSGVLHAGIYYEPGSMKARYCVEGNRALAVFCDAHGLPLRRCGKVIVAADERSEARLAQLHRRGTENGVPDLRLLDRAELKEIEPNVEGRMALYAPRSAIVDYRAIGATYATIFRGAGGRTFTQTRFLDANRDGGRTRVLTDRGDFDATLVINCGGLHCDLIARKMGADPGLQIVPFRGEYYLLDRGRRDLVNGLVYPVPDPSLPFLDVHLTPKISGDVEAGPNAVLATRREGYRWRDFALREFAGTLAFPGFWRLAARNVKPGLAEINRSLRKSVFVKSLQKLVPAIDANDLTAGGSGVRAQAVDRRGMLVDDFQIAETADAIHVLNAPSPAATSSMMIGRFVANKADLRLNSR